MPSADSAPPVTIKLNRRGVWIPLGLAGACVMFLLGAGWKANAFLTSIQNDITASRQSVESLRSEIRANANYRWTPGDMEHWAYQLEKANRDIKLTVPDTRQVMRDRQNNSGS